MNTNMSSKRERINIRLQYSAKETLETAAEIEGKTVSGFILNSALAHAEKTIHGHNVMKLNRQDSERFINALSNPPKVNKKLASAIDEYNRRVTSK